MTDLAKNEEFLKAAFKGYDLNSDGRVTVKEFRRIMVRTGGAEIESRVTSLVFRENERWRYREND